MATSSYMTDMTALFRKELELCKVKTGEKVAVLSELGRQTEYASAFMSAAHDLGAEVFNMNLLSPSDLSGGEKLKAVGQTALAGNRSAIEALKGTDLVIDLMFLLFSKEQLE